MNPCCDIDFPLLKIQHTNTWCDIDGSHQFQRQTCCISHLSDLYLRFSGGHLFRNMRNIILLHEMGLRLCWKTLIHTALQLNEDFMSNMSHPQRIYVFPYLWVITTAVRLLSYSGRARVPFCESLDGWGCKFVEFIPALIEVGPTEILIGCYGFRSTPNPSVESATLLLTPDRLVWMKEGKTPSVNK